MATEAEPPAPKTKLDKEDLSNFAKRSLSTVPPSSQNMIQQRASTSMMEKAGSGAADNALKSD